MIPQWAFLSREKIVKKHIPEKQISLMKYSRDKWMKYFGIPDPRLQISNIGIYSVAKPYMGARLLQFIKSQIGDISKLTVTETHGGLGGFSIPLSREFALVQPVEIEKIHANIIKNNAKALGAENIKVYNDDYMDVMMSLSQNVIVSDPPWGGPDYRSKQKLSLGLNNVNIVHIINILHENNRFDLFVLLVPANYDFNEFIQHLAVNAIAKVHIEYVDAEKPNYFFIGIKK